MTGTGAGTGPGTSVAEESIHPNITHAGTRRALVEGVLPGGHEIMRFPQLSESRMVTAVDLVEDRHDRGALDPRIASTVVVGHLAMDGDEAQAVVVDGETGRVFSLSMCAPQHAELYPLAPSLDALGRFLTAVGELGSLSGRFTHLRGCFGAPVVEEASVLLRSVFTDENWGADGWGDVEWEGEVPSFWRIAALIRPMALIAAPGRGLHLDLPADFIEEEFGTEEVVRLAPGDLPEALEHEPTRRFLTEVGLPKDGLMFWLDTPEDILKSMTVASAERQANPDLRHLNLTGELPEDSDRLLVIGGLMHDFDTIVDGRTGLVHYALMDDDTVTPVNADVSTLAFTVWMHSRQQKLEKEYELAGSMGEFYHQVADTMIAVLATADPVACLPATGPDDYRYWPEVFHDEAGAVL
ncbi:SUKH-4 family immunity protein [Streptomyces mutomycini]|uniref:SUKH-4 family immunity protein n=1 Tax=Streptomyces mutomycini TaxID=284036 RepID=A0ABW0AY77_9ACTN|nr:SUKH-4 family immunity protein [Streptomyces mutomycini]